MWFMRDGSTMGSDVPRSRGKEVVDHSPGPLTAHANRVPAATPAESEASKGDRPDMKPITPGGGGSSGERPSEAANLSIELVPYPGSWLLRLAAMVSRMNPARWFRRNLCQWSFPAAGWPARAVGPPTRNTGRNCRPGAALAGRAAWSLPVFVPVFAPLPDHPGRPAGGAQATRKDSPYRAVLRNAGCEEDPHGRGARGLLRLGQLLGLSRIAHCCLC